MWSGNGTSFHAVAVAVFALFVVLPMLPITPPPLLPPGAFLLFRPYRARCLFLFQKLVLVVW